MIHQYSTMRTFLLGMIIVPVVVGFSADPSTCSNVRQPKFNSYCTGECTNPTIEAANSKSSKVDDNQPGQPFAIVLGIAQDAGFPQAGCRKQCCAAAWDQTELRRHATCLAIIDPDSKQRWILECTPDFRDQLRLLDEHFPVENSPGLDGIFLTHAHIGHYVGLVHLGREVMNAKRIPVHTLPRMNTFLSTNGPWDRLVKLENIVLMELGNGVETKLNKRVSITPLTVPHRDEYSETAAFIVNGGNRKLLFLPDIDKWDRWGKNIVDVLKTVDVAFVDGSFYADGEIAGRNMSEIPHPFITESMERFGQLPASERQKIHFIHLNHTNPALQTDSKARNQIERMGMNVAEQSAVIEL